MLIAICENDENQTTLTKNLIKKYMDERKIKYGLYCYPSGEKLLENWRSFDLVLMDVEMDKLSGIETAARIREKDDRVYFFFITAHSEYMDAAMNNNILRFFQKPINEERFFRGMDKAVDMIYENSDRIYLSCGSKTVSVTFKDIAIIEIAKRKTNVITKFGDFLSSEKMEHWLEILPDSHFSSPHKSFIINFNYLSAMASNNVTITVNQKNYTVPISPKRKKPFKEAFFGYTNRIQK